MSEQDRDDELDAAYRRASAVDAGRPGDSVRARILAEAQAAARRNTPAANQSRYWMSAVAGVAVLGVAVMVMRQVDYQLPGAAPATVAVPVATEVGDAGAVADTAVVRVEPTSVPDAAAGASTTQARAAPRARADEAERRESESGGNRESEARPEQRLSVPEVTEQQQAMQADVTAPAAPPPAPASPPPAVQSRQADDVEVEEVAVTGSRIQRPGAAGAANQAPAGRPSALQLLQRHLPSVYESDRPLSVWLVQDTAGEVLRLGELRSGETSAALTATIEPTLGGRRIASWRNETVVNARGQRIQLSIGEAR